MRLSVILCSHNPREASLTRTMDALRGQSMSPNDWELIVVDNASDSPLSAILDISWHPQASVILESELGLTPARLRGVSESHGDILCFVDDDNLLDPGYLESAMRIGQEMPFLGCWGGEIIGEFEVSPPEWFTPFYSMLAVRPLARDSWGNAYRYDDALPCGAGMCVRRQVVDRYFRECAHSNLRKSLDRKGGSLASNGDVDLAYTAIDLGYGTGRFKSLRLTHLIPAARLELDYLARLADSMAVSNLLLDSCRTATAPRQLPKFSLWSDLWASITLLKRGPAYRTIAMAKRRGLRRAVNILSNRS